MRIQILIVCKSPPSFPHASCRTEACGVPALERDGQQRDQEDKDTCTGEQPPVRTGLIGKPLQILFQKVCLR